MEKIVEVHYPGLRRELLAEALASFFRVRETPGLRKKPSTSELLDWIKLLLAEEIPPEALRSDDPRKSIPPLYGALLKNEQDVHLFEQLVFLSRRAGRLRPRRADPFLFRPAQGRRPGLDHRTAVAAGGTAGARELLLG
jgi:hypothetical protein